MKQLNLIFLSALVYFNNRLILHGFVQPNPELEKLLDEFCPPGQQTSDWKIFSPLHSQMQSELGNQYMYDSLTGDINNNQQGVPFQYGTNANDNYDFLNSVLIEPDKQSVGGINDVSCSESEGEVTQKQVRKLFRCVSGICWTLSSMMKLKSFAILCPF